VGFTRAYHRGVNWVAEPANRAVAEAILVANVSGMTPALAARVPLPRIRDAIVAMDARRRISLSLLTLACSPAEPVTVVESDASPSRDVTRADAGFDLDARLTADVPPLDVPRAVLPEVGPSAGVVGHTRGVPGLRENRFVWGAP
jgi:hypothetical protein